MDGVGVNPSMLKVHPRSNSAYAISSARINIAEVRFRPSPRNSRPLPSWNPCPDLYCEISALLQHQSFCPQRISETHLPRGNCVTMMVIGIPTAIRQRFIPRDYVPHALMRQVKISSSLPWSNVSLTWEAHKRRGDIILSYSHMGSDSHLTKENTYLITEPLQKVLHGMIKPRYVWFRYSHL